MVIQRLECQPPRRGRVRDGGVHWVQEGPGGAAAKWQKVDARGTRDKETMYSLHIIGLVGGVGVDVLRHGADLPLLHVLMEEAKSATKPCTMMREEKEEQD